MADQDAASPNGMVIAIGALTAMAGVYFALVGIEAVPPPSKIHGPIWLSLFVALVFFSMGIAVLVRGATGADDGSGDLPVNAPVWVKTVYWLGSLLAASGLAALGTWIAFGTGPHHFSMSGPIAGPVGDGIGRVVFGIGAIITWLLVVVMARTGAKKIFGKKS